MREIDYRVRNFVAYVLTELSCFDVKGPVSFDIPLSSRDDPKNYAVVRFSVDPKTFQQIHQSMSQEAD